MTTVAAPIAKTVPPFPAASVTDTLRGELLQAVRRLYRRKGLPLPKGDDSVAILVVEIDSLSVVELLSSLDDVLPFEVTECVVKPGGYRSIKAAVEHVTSRVESKWNKHYSGGKA